jgi:hypothetical protein
MQQDCLALILFSSLSLGLTCAHGQASSPPGDKNASARVPSSSVAPDAPVITIDGLCGDIPWSIATPSGTSPATGSAKSGRASSLGRDAACKTVITRMAFEKLASEVVPGQPPQANLKIAQYYSEQLIFAHRAHQLGLDKDPHFEYTVKYQDLQVLYRTMRNYLQQEAANIPEFEKYYKEHFKQFEQVELLRLTIPKTKDRSSEAGSSAPSANMDIAADEAALKAEADKLRSEAVAGGDFEELQDEAYAAANHEENPLEPAMGKVTRGRLGQFQELVFDQLQPGQVSQVVSQADFWVIFKVVSKGMMPRDEAREYLTQLRMKEAWDSLQNSVKPRLNDSYFEPAPEAEASEQAAPARLPDNKSASAPLPPSNVAPEDSVITLDGLCGDTPWSIAKPVGTSKATDRTNSGSAGSPASDAGCKNVITRAAFEKHASEIAPGRPPQAEIATARGYAAQLVFAHRAHELGLDKDPHFDDIVNFTNLQLLSHAMTNHLQQQADKMPEAEFKKYYKEHPEEFEEVELLQLTIPKHKEQSSESESFAPPPVNTPPDEIMKEEAEKLRSQAIAGGNFKKLEEEAYTVAGDVDLAPDPVVGKVTRDTARQFQQLIFDELQPGQISELVTYQDSWLIFKVVSKQVMPLDEAKKFTVPWTQEASDSLKNSFQPQFNETYFVTSRTEAAKPSGNHAN